MSEPLIVRCKGCGVLNTTPRTQCVSCRTVLPSPLLAGSLEPVHPATALSPDSQRSAELHAARISGVIRLFLAILGLAVAIIIADKSGAPEHLVDLAATVIMAIMALLCAITARSEIGPLLARTGGWRGPMAAIAGLMTLVTFGALYFPVVRRLGFPMLSMSQPYLAAGWPIWSAYLSVSVAPAIFEELTFRGYIMARLDTLLTANETLLVQAAIFALLHLGVVIFPSHFVIGLVLGIVRRRTRSLYPGMAVHFGWNALVLWTELHGVDFP